jgi:carbamoyl-phosphate synthase small subunit
MKAVLVLEDGSCYQGSFIGKARNIEGEVVFNTGMTGYQEALTDPSYHGQILVMTYPFIGNTGINPEDAESFTFQPRALVAKEISKLPSNFRSQAGLVDLMQEQKFPCMEGVDTRALTIKIRELGSMRGVIAPAEADKDELIQKARSIPYLHQQDLISQVSTSEPYTFSHCDGPTVAVIDFGVKKSILQSLADRGLRVRVLPYDTEVSELMDEKPDGVLFSNGPGDPSNAVQGIELAKKIVGRFPILGICLGHQIIALSFGADLYKLKFGHRGSNHPVKDLINNRTYITSQNHSYAVKSEGLNPDLIITDIHLNDGTVEGLKHKYLPVSTLQYHPEAAPGPKDCNHLLDRFSDQVADYAESTCLN